MSSAAPASPAAAALHAAVVPVVPLTVAGTAMGGRLLVHLDIDAAGPGVAGRMPERFPAGSPRHLFGRASDPERAGRIVISRVRRWSDQISRRVASSQLTALNVDPSAEVAVRPALAAALHAARLAADASEQLVDVTLLAERLAAEGLLEGSATLASSSVAAAGGRSTWTMTPTRRGSALVQRVPDVRIDLDGVGKGWLADRALALLEEWPGAIVDADGDLAIRTAPGRHWEIAIDDQRATTDGDPDAALAILHLPSLDGLPTRWGVATSGRSVHRWSVGGELRHHLIDPRTRRSAQTDVIQATVIAESALRAEALAKAAVIAGSAAGFALLARANVRGAVLLTERGQVLALPQTGKLLAS